MILVGDKVLRIEGFTVRVAVVALAVPPPLIQLTV
jgi:hypothetical protein